MYTVCFLPEEILSNISIFLDVEDIFNFALTCSRSYNNLKPRLQRNQRYYERNKVQHDRLPLTAPTLLRMALNLADERWQIRTFDVWDARVKFADWKNRMYYYTDGSDLWGDPHDETYLSETYYGLEDSEAFKRVMKDELNLDDDSIDRWSLKIINGWDEPIKGMLSALLPRLKRLTFLAFQNYNFHTEVFDDVKKHPLTFITSSIESIERGLYEGKISKWPAGFQSLREISVCADSSYLHPRDTWFVPASVAASLLKLPNLKILQLSLVGQTDLEPEENWTLAPGVSNVEQLSFYTCRFLGLTTWIRYIRACRRLRRLYIDHLEIDYGEHLFTMIMGSHGKSLEYLWLQCPYQIGLHSMAQSFPNLKHLGHFKDTNLLQTHLCHPEMIFRPERTTHIHAFQRIRRDGNRAPYRIADLRCLLPVSIETFQLNFDTFRFLGDQKLLSLIAIRAELLRAVADLVEDQKFSRLRQVCLYELLGAEYVDPTVLKTYPWTDNIAYEWDWKALQRIKAKGIETHLHDDQGKAYTLEQHRRLHLEDVYGPGGEIIESDPKFHNAFY